MLAAVYQLAARRAFWVGFSACGRCYFLCVFGPEPLSSIGQARVTTAMLDIIYPYTVPATAATAALDLGDSPMPSAHFVRRSMAPHGPRVVLTGGLGVLTGPPVPPPTPWQIWTRPDRMTQFNQSSPRAFQRIGHSLFA